MEEVGLEAVVGVLVDPHIAHRVVLLQLTNKESIREMEK